VIASLPFLGALLESDGGLGAVSTFFALVLGGIGHVAGIVAAIAVVATYLRAAEDGSPIGAKDAFVRVGARARDLIGGLVRGVLIVVLLLISLVGIPWGVRQAVRYQFLAQVTALEGSGGRAALDRSSALVRGRWLHTAVVIALLNLLVGAVAGAAGLVMLVLLSGIPLWLFSALVTLVAAAIVPYAAIGFVLLYGDALAVREGMSAAELREQGLAARRGGLEPG
jgi:hypothetical protein